MITLSRVSKHFGPVALLEEAEAVFPSPGVTFLMGPNGVGKTTLIKCILGLEQYSGKILWNGRPVNVSERLVYPVFDDVPFHERLTGIQNLNILARESARGPRQYLDSNVLRRKVKSYSSGQRTRLALTAALNSGAELIILDEPTNGLDRDAMRRLKDDITELRGSTSFLITGHHLEFYDDLVDHLFVLKSGKLVEVPVESSTDTARSSNLAFVYDVHYTGTER